MFNLIIMEFCKIFLLKIVSPLLNIVRHLYCIVIVIYIYIYSMYSVNSFFCDHIKFSTGGNFASKAG